MAIVEEEINFDEISEGKAKILYPKSNSVFYNSVQVFNRDISILVIKVFKKELEEKLDSAASTAKHSNGPAKSSNFKILEALSATGLRATRYALEIPNVGNIIANDLSKPAVEIIQKNIKHNNVESIVNSSHADASLLMYQHRFPASKQFQVIDLDPYGSPTMFLDGAVQSICDGGLLCVTCTDMGALCGNHGEAAYAKYGSLPIKAKCCHEMALRIVLNCIDSHAGRYKRYIKPLLSLSADFYVRVFVQIFTNANEVKRAASKRSYIFQCNGCDAIHFQPVGRNIENGNSKKFVPGTGPVVGQKCLQCDHAYKIGGPIWSEPIHDRSFVRKLDDSLQQDRECYATYDRMNGMLNVIMEEVEDIPLYYVLDKLCSIVHCTTPPQVQFRSALLHRGYRASSTHCHENGFKTDATVDVIWDILRCWVQKNPVNEKKISKQPAALKLLSKTPSFEADFSELPEAIPKSKILKMVRYQVNPEPDWGPKARAGQQSKYENINEKRHSLQGKRQRNKDPDYWKQYQCKRFKRGECDKGENCKYSHDEATVTMEAASESSNVT